MVKKKEIEQYTEDSYEREHFKSKPFGGVEGYSGSSSRQNTGYGRPKAVAAPKRTAAENRPYIAKGLGELQEGMPQTNGIDYTVGDRVRHIKYGEGTVLKIEEEPRDYKVTVVFDGAGQKIMYAAFAKLKKV